jgi:outer membrane protein assembly factor BamB
MGKLLSLDPATDVITDRGSSQVRAVCLAFGPDGLLYVGGYAPAGATGPSLPVLQWPALTKVGDFPQAGPLYKMSPEMPIWGLLPDADGGVYVRVVEDGYLKGAGAFNFKKVYPDGTSKPFVDFGYTYGKRAVYHPLAAHYALAFDPEHNVVLASLPLESVMKLSPDGKILWEAGLEPQGGAAKLDLGDPQALALDSGGNIWVVDSQRAKLYCLSPEGKLLLTFGGPGGVDDLSGNTFDSPTAVAIATVNGVEYLYVGDAGNMRLVKYRLDQG